MSSSMKGAFLEWFEKPLNIHLRTFLCIPIAALIVYLGAQRYATNSLFEAFWERDFSNFWHGFTGLGHTGVVEYQMPGGVVGLIAACLVFFVAYKGIAHVPSRLNLHYLLLVILDFFVLAILVNLFIFSGTAFELFMYAGSFLLGALVFGNRITGQMTLIALTVILLIRLVYMDSIHPNLFYIPVLGLIYILLRAPFGSETFTDDLRNFSLKQVFARS